ncbi:hypothetical protein Nepgr_004862 [Nepenthes gracilis]|uniref:Arabinogalactan-protein n=1 Tax=Nepenthes gracilis TaxID=150966 RepID=A0AAD3S215_NEPGR|nr:hypothetical protein Nepgr_004862 [Nepenthes gracilis]
MANHSVVVLLILAAMLATAAFAESPSPAPQISPPGHAPTKSPEHAQAPKKAHHKTPPPSSTKAVSPSPTSVSSKTATAPTPGPATSGVISNNFAVAGSITVGAFALALIV